MHLKLTAELREALEGGPGPVLFHDHETNRNYPLVESSYLELLFDRDDRAAIRAGVADFEAGRTSALADAIADITERRRA